MQSADSRFGSWQALRFCTALYSGVGLAGLVTIVVAGAGRSTTIALSEPSPITLAGTYAITVLVGTVAGAALTDRDPNLAPRLGRSWGRRLAVLVPAVPFGALALAAWLGAIDGPIGPIAFATTVAIVLVGHVLGRIAQTRYVETVTGDDPIATVAWTPPSSPRLEAVVFVLWVGLALLNAIDGSWWATALWATLGLIWVASRVASGSWPIGVGARPELRVHEAGLVKRRPFTASLVSWESVDRARLREGELVLDRGLLDVRFDSDELADSTLALETIERRIR